MKFLTEFQATWWMWWLQMFAYILILTTLAVIGWWLSIVITDLIKRLKTGDNKWTAL